MKCLNAYRKVAHRTAGVGWFLCVVGLLLAQLARAQVVIGADVFVGSGAIMSMSADSIVLNNAMLINQGQLHIGQTGQKVNFLGLLYQDGGKAFVKATNSNIASYTSVSDGELHMNGTTPQAIRLNGNAMEILVADNPTSVTLEDSVFLAERMQVASGTLKTTPTGHIQGGGQAAFIEHTPGAFAGNYKTEKVVSGLLPVDFGPYLTLNPNGNDLGTVRVLISSGLDATGVTYRVNPNNPLMRSIDRVWDIKPTQQPNPALPVGVTLKFNPGLENAGQNLRRTQVWKTPSGAPMWSKVGAVVNALSGTVTTTTTSFSTWTMSSENSPLPLTLLSFHARKEGRAALLHWATQWEVDVQSFIIERSTDGLVYESIGSTAAIGTGAKVQQYTFTDSNAGSLGVPVVYYRLKELTRAQQVNVVGHAALPWQQEDMGFRLFPNPVTDHFFLDLATSQEAKLWLVNELGQTVWTGTYAANMTYQAQQFTLPQQLPAALYMLHAERGGQRHAFKVVKH